MTPLTMTEKSALLTIRSRPATSAGCNCIDGVVAVRVGDVRGGNNSKRRIQY